MTDPQPQPQQPPAGDVQKAEQVTQAGAAAAAGAEPGQEGAAASQAMRAKADEVKLDIPDEIIERMSDMISSHTIVKLDERGAFDASPEPVQAPAQPTAPPAPGEPPQTGEQQPQQPQKRSWAHRFMGA